jgi:WD40 repeat protein
VVSVLEGHERSISAVTFSPDGQILASASSDLTLRLWNVNSGALLLTLEGHKLYINAITFSPDSKALASASNDMTVRLWNTSSGAAVSTLNGHRSFVDAVAFSSDSQILASASSDETVRLWEASTGALLSIFETGTTVRQLSFAVDGSCLVTSNGLLDLIYVSPTAATTTSTAALSLCTSNRGPHLRPRPPHLQSSIFVKGQWVARGTDNLLWLPPDHRPTRVAVRDGVAVLGCASGQVSFLELSY